MRGDLSEAEEWGGCRGSSSSTPPKPPTLTLQLRRLQDWGVACVPGSSSLSHHRHPTSCAAAYAPKLRRQAYFFFFVCSCSNFRKCTTLFVRWPKCKFPKNWYCCLSQCFCFFFFCMYVRITRVKECNGFHLDLGLFSNGPYLRLNCHILLSDWFGIAFVLQSVFELSPMSEKEGKKHKISNWFHAYALNRRSKFVWSSTSHVTPPPTNTRNGKRWNVVIKKNLLLKNRTPECFFWRCRARPEPCIYTCSMSGVLVQP